MFEVGLVGQVGLYWLCEILFRFGKAVNFKFDGFFGVSGHGF